jgi:hypothetical protein
MAKDARGHGSDGRGGSVPDQHQFRIARDTVKNPLKGQFLGGMNAAQAENLLRTKFGHSDAQIAALKGGDGPKSVPVATHPSMTGRSDADLEKDYGGPVRHFGPDSSGRTVTVSEYSKGKTTYPKVK